MPWRHTLFKACSTLVPGHGRVPAGILFPYAHVVSDVVPLHIRHLHAVPSVAQFKSNLDFLARNYRALELSQLPGIADCHNSKRPACGFVLSFDDGMREVYDLIAPILREKGIPAVFFLNSATVDNQQLMWRHKVSLLIERSKQQPASVPPQLRLQPGATTASRLKRLRFAHEPILDEIARFFEVDFSAYLRKAKPYLTTDQVMRLAQDGFEFGAHGHSHPHFEEITIEEQKQQVNRSVCFVRQLGLPCRSFAFPFNDRGVPISVFNHIRDLNIAFSFGTSEARVDSIPFSFQRFALDAENAEATVPHILHQLAAKSLVHRIRGTELIRRN